MSVKDFTQYKKYKQTFDRLPINNIIESFPWKFFFWFEYYDFTSGAQGVCEMCRCKEIVVAGLVSLSSFLSSRRKIHQWIYGANGPWHTPHERQWKLKKGDRGWMADSLLKDRVPLGETSFSSLWGWPSTVPSRLVTRHAHCSKTCKFYLTIFPNPRLNRAPSQIFERSLNFNGQKFVNTFDGLIRDTGGS